ncbi:MAG: hypothetical protein LBK94_06390 [Prevotellaceae bacterium]|jgi:hypothetical protein|nr:hypothetical protein [Prevotellaceae bacterium]
MKINKIIGIIILSLIICSCSKRGNDILLAEAHGEKLYLSDLTDIFPVNNTDTDSASAISTYTSAWVRRQLTVKKAEEMLDEKQKDVAAEIKDYRSSLLIYRLEHDYISKNMDTLVTQDEIESIYNENIELFKIQSALIKATYIKIQTETPETENIKKMCLVSNDANMKTVEELCMVYADKYDSFNGKWLETYELSRLLPQNTNYDEFEKILMSKRFYEAKDTEYSYFIKLQSILEKGSISPLEKETENIRTIILNRRKRELISKLEEETYNAGISNKDAKIYINNHK